MGGLPLLAELLASIPGQCPLTPVPRSLRGGLQPHTAPATLLLPLTALLLGLIPHLRGAGFVSVSKYAMQLQRVQGPSDRVAGATAALGACWDDGLVEGPLQPPVD